MKVAIIGATGFVGSNILNELISRNHDITAIARNPEATKTQNSQVKWVKADVLQVEELSKVLAGNDVVISAFNAGWTNPNLYNDFLAGSRAIQSAVKKAGVKRFITIGGAGSLFAAPNLQFVDTPEFPAEYKAGATAARDYLNEIKNEKEIDWVFFSPALEMHPGISTGRTGQYRVGLDTPVFDADNRSILSGEDLAVVIVDEAEQANHHHQRFTAAY
ncbi:NAD(P)-dependent oxidoreductase [Flavobacterium sp. '19STA2R22 D10 B1']|uniref:NAD(P)-dependent oxidoreductase n=1 Tax=Flavobacterium aerium TaxID=3037261 RepID=UPI00278BE44A|nr:NAD(P)H-binding protein [Flavobacterium sp. '19STA2R22 D10 B1']